MPDQLDGHLLFDPVLFIVRPHNPVQIAHGERVGIGGLLQIHHLPEQDVGLQRLVQVPRTETGNLRACPGDQIEFHPAGGIGLLLREFGRELTVSFGQQNRRAHRLDHRVEVLRPIRRVRLLSLDLPDQRVQPSFQRIVEGGQRMSCHALDEVGSLPGLRAGLLVHLAQLHRDRIPVPERPVLLDHLPCDLDPFGCPVRPDVVVVRVVVAIPDEAPHLERGIDQRVTGRERVRLRTREDLALLDRERQFPTHCDKQERLHHSGTVCVADLEQLPALNVLYEEPSPQIVRIRVLFHDPVYVATEPIGPECFE